MGNFLKKFFYVPKYGKIREEVMLAQLAFTAVILISCLAAMCHSAYAWFSCDVTSGSSIIKAADFDITASVTVTENDVQKTVDANDDGTYSLPSGIYTVNLAKKGTAKTGFCIIEAAFDNVKATYHTQQIGVDGSAETTTLAFTLDLTNLSGDAVVTFTPHWGTSHYYGYPALDSDPHYIKAEKTVIVTADSADTISQSEEKNTSDATDSSSGVQSGEVIYTVVSGDTLIWIAQRYNTTSERIAAYNDLTDPRLILPGQQLKIPPADWKIPSNSTTSTGE